MTAHGAQNCQRLLLHFQQGLELQQGGAVLALAQQVRHLENHGIQHRLRHGVDVGLSNLVSAGVGADLADLTAESRHGAAGDVDEVCRQIVADALALGHEVTAHPGDQLPLALLGKLHDGGAAVNGLPQLFQPLVGLPRYRLVGKDHGAVIGNVRKDLGHLVSVCLRQLEQVDLVHMDQGVVRHHGQIFHGIGEILDRKRLVVETVEVEGFGQIVQQDLLHLTKIVVQQEDFLTMENIEPVQLLCLDGLLEGL